VTTVPDHETVSFEVLVKLERYKLDPRKIYQFHKANKEVIIVEVCKFVGLFFEEKPYEQTTQENWHRFQTNLVNIVNKYISSKLIRPHKDVSWLNYSIKRKMKIHNKLYIQEKCTQNKSDWAAYKELDERILS